MFSRKQNSRNRISDQLTLCESLDRVRLNWPGAKIEKLCHGRVRVTVMSCGTVTTKTESYADIIKWASFIGSQGNQLRRRKNKAFSIVKRLDTAIRAGWRDTLRKITVEPEAGEDSYFPNRKEDIWNYD